MRQVGPGSPFFFVGLPKPLRRLLLVHFVCGTILIFFAYKMGFFSSLARLFKSNIDRSDILSYFPEINQDGSIISWAHAVNSKAALKAAIKSPSHMVESDIIMGLANGNKSPEPIMAHPPVTTSDLSFDVWLDSLKHSDKGIKLDFKSIKPVGYCLQSLSDKDSSLRGPVIVNADILYGPNSHEVETQALDSKTFIALFLRHYPRAVLSLGWVTKDGRQGYGWQHVHQMYDVLKSSGVINPTGEVLTRVTFAVRASLCHSSTVTKLRWLLDMVPKSTLTVWTGKNDRRKRMDDLLFLRHVFPTDRVFLDIGDTYSQENIKEISKLGSDSERMQKQFSHLLSDQLNLRANWDLLKSTDTLLFPAEVSFLQVGHGIGLLSRQELSSSYSRSTNLKLTVHGWSTDPAGTTQRLQKCRLSIVFRSKEYIDNKLRVPEGVVSLLEFSTGRLAIQSTSERDAKQVEDRFDNDLQMGLNCAYRLNVQDDGSRVVLAVSVLDQYNADEPVIKSSKRLVLQTKLNSDTVYRVAILAHCDNPSSFLAFHDIKLGQN